MQPNHKIKAATSEQMSLASFYTRVLSYDQVDLILCHSPFGSFLAFWEAILRVFCGMVYGVCGMWYGVWWYVYGQKTDMQSPHIGYQLLFSD